MSDGRSKDTGYAWVVSFGAHLCKIVHDGIFKSFGVMLLPLSSQFDTSNWVVGFSVSLMIVVGGVFALITKPFLRSFQPRWLMIVFAIFTHLGFVLCTFATNWTVFAILMIAVIGIPLRLSWFIMLSSLGDYFDKHYAVASSIAFLGSSVALAVFAPLTQLLLDTYGWKGSMLILGSISLHISICGVLLKSSNGYVKLAATDSEEKPSSSESIWKNVKEICDSELFRQSLFHAVMAAEFASQYCFAGWIIYLIPYARSIGLSPYNATTLATAGGVGSCIGTIFSGVLFKKTEHMVYIFTIFQAIATCSLFLYYFHTSFAMLMIASFVFGIAVNLCLVGCLILVRLVEGDHGILLGWIFFASSLGRLFAGFLTGWVRDVTGSYDMSFVILGGVMMASTCIFAVLTVLNRKQDDSL